MRFLLGILVSAAWMLVNSFFLMRLGGMVARPGTIDPAKQKNRIFALSLVKFPLLYLGGFFILKSRFFPVMSILTGLTVSLVILAGWWITRGRKWNY